MNVLFPVQPDPPTRVQVPVIVFPFTVPLRLRTLLLEGNVVVMSMASDPVTLPL